MTKRSRDLPEYVLNHEITSRLGWFRQELLTWFHLHGRNFPWREPGRTAYEILVAEILLQRTTAAKVAQAYKAFLARYPSWSSLAHTSLEDLQEHLKPLGLWLQKALVFQSLAQAIDERDGSLPVSRAELEQLPGIGQYIANAVLLAFYKHPEPLVDVNMARVLERFFGSRKLADIRYDPYLQTLARRVVNTEQSLQLNWAILDLGALVCKHGTPLCVQCPLRLKCDTSKKSATESVGLPVMYIAEATPVYGITSSEGACSETPTSAEVVPSPCSTSELLVVHDSPAVAE